VAATVLIACPDTGDLVPTGVRADLLPDLPAINHLEACAGCGNDHDWTRDESVVTTATD
jgi:hypothetical protein